ncbi:hypothetical protein F5Y07DRAFT_402232 [Xylaria sp. FL0933]|nr:hypothetical protein F5Y07DRAFT_402232 [Xylaria sp. FL0933]
MSGHGRIFPRAQYSSSAMNGTPVQPDHQHPPLDQPHSSQNMTTPQRIAVELQFQDILNSISNIRDQLDYWCDRVQQAEAAQAVLEERFKDIKGRTLCQRQNQTARVLYELLSGRLEALEQSLTEVEGNGSAHSESNRNVENESNRSAMKIAAIIKTNSLHPKTTKPGSLNLLPEDYTVLTEEGLFKLLRDIDFGELSHLQLLSKLDNRSIPRDIPISCDITIPNPPSIFYVLRCGPGASYIVNHPACRRSAARRAEELEAHGVRDLRVVRLSYYLKRAKRSEEEERRANKSFALWQKTARPPQYAYDLGQLVLTGIEECQDDLDFIPTRFNLMVDMISPRKPVWLVMRPDFKPSNPGDPDRDQTRKYLTLPSEQHTGDHRNGPGNHTRTEINCCVAARVAKSITELRIVPESFNCSFISKLYDGSEYGMKLLPDADVRVQYVMPSFDEIMQTVGEGCSAVIDSDDEYYN